MTLLETLRSETRPLHGRLDRLMAGRPVTSSRASYGDYLRRFHAGVGRCWPMLDWRQLGEQGLPDVAEREDRYRFLERDLRALGLPAEPLPDVALETADGAAMTGCLYVLEGSIHGGSVLMKSLETSEPELAASAARFLDGFGDLNRTRWEAFLSWLATRPADDRSMKQAAEAASAAFGHFLAVFQQARTDSPTIS